MIINCYDVEKCIVSFGKTHNLLASATCFLLLHPCLFKKSWSSMSVSLALLTLLKLELHSNKQLFLLQISSGFDHCRNLFSCVKVSFLFSWNMVFLRNGTFRCFSDVVHRLTCHFKLMRHWLQFTNIQWQTLENVRFWQRLFMSLINKFVCKFLSSNL